MGVILAFISVSLYGTLGPIAKKMGATFHEFTFMAITMSVLTLVSIGAALTLDKNFSWSSLTAGNVMLLVLFGLINFGSFSLSLIAYKNGLSVMDYQLISLLLPIIGGVMAFFMLGEQIHAKQLIGLVIMGVGLYVALHTGKEAVAHG